MSDTPIEYPLMLFIDGDIEKDSTIVVSAEEEKAAKADGFRRLGAKQPSPTKADKP